MRIVEIGDCSMVIMKDSEDPPWVSVGNIYREATKYKERIRVHTKMDYYSLKPIRQAASQISKDYIYSGGMLILFFSETLSPHFHLHDRVELGFA